MIRPNYINKLCALIMCIFLISVTAQAESPLEIKEKLEDNLFIDATISSPILDPLEASVIYVYPAKPDVRVLQQELVPEINILNQSINPARNPLSGESFRAIYENGTTLSVDQMKILFSTVLGAMVWQINMLEPILNNEALLLPDLNFSKRTDIANKAESILNSIGIQDLSCISIYALNQQVLQSYSDRIINNADLKEDISEGRIFLKSEWKNSDECYDLIFEILFSSIPVFYQPYRDIAGNTFLGSSIEMVISAHGIEGIRGYDLVVEESREEPKPLLGSEEVPALIRNYYRNLIVENPTTITEISLMYVKAKIPGNKDKLQLIPAWCCKYIETASEGEQLTQESWLAFDARTGEMLF